MLRRSLIGTLTVLVVISTAGCATKSQSQSGSTPPVESSFAPETGVETNQIIPGSERDFQVNAGDRVYFAYDQWTLNDASRNVLRRQAVWLQRYPAVVLTIEGHCDERGTREYNLALGARRAAAVKEYLASIGVSAGRLETISYGKERPVCTDSTEGCWSQNRRAVSVIRAGTQS